MSVASPESGVAAAKLEGRVAIVTGAAGGIGAAIARALAADGARVLVADTAATTGTVEMITASGGEADGIRCDVSDPGQVGAMIDFGVERFGGIDILINDAGVGGGSGMAHETAIEDWLHTIAVNLTGTFLCVRARRCRSCCGRVAAGSSTSPRPTG